VQQKALSAQFCAIKGDSIVWSKETFLKEMNKFDPLLRLRESKIEPGVVFIERKASRETACVPKPKDRYKIDDYRRNAEGHILLLRARKNELGKHLLLELRAHDMWEYRGAGYYADALEAQEKAEEERKEREQSQFLQNISEEAYDRAMVKQGDIVSNFHQKV
jgi:hypothetical protein